MSVPADSLELAVLPILPAVHSVLTVLLLCGSGVVAGLWALRHPRSWRLVLRFVWSQKWSLLGIAAVIGLGATLLGRLTPGEPERAAPLPTAEGEWIARGGDRRLGSTPDAQPPKDAVVQWVGGVGYTFYASPAVVEDRVYTVGFAADRGRLFCWNARTGRSLWTRAVPGYRASFSSPVIHDGCLYVGEGLHRTPRCSVFAIDLQSGHEGEVLWSYPTDSHVECTPVIGDDQLFVTAGDDGVYALALRPADGSPVDAAPDRDVARLRWHVEADEAPDVETSICYHDGHLFVGLGQGGNSLLAMDANTGAEMGRIPMPFPVHGLPSIADGRLYVGMGTGDYVNYSTSRGQVACIDLDSFTVEWTFPLKGTVLGAIVCDQDRVCFGCTDGHVYSVSGDGQILASWNSRAPILASPALAGDTIFIVNRAGVLYALDRSSLEPLWESRLGPPGNYLSSPVVADGRLFVGTPSDGFLCLGNNSADVGGEPRLFDLSTRGQMVWQARVGDEILAAPAASDTTLLVSYREEQIARIGGLCIDTAAPPTLAWSRKLSSTPTFVETVAGEIAIVSTSDDLLALDAPTGEILWTVTAHSAEAPVIEGNLIWVNEGGAGAQEWVARSLSSGQPASTTRRQPAQERKPREIFLRADGGRLLRNDSIESQGIPNNLEAKHAGADVPVPMQDGRVQTIEDGSQGTPNKIEAKHAVADVPVPIQDGRVQTIEDGSAEAIWYDLSSLGQIIFSPLIVGDRVYVALSDGTLVGLEGAENE